eukprot:2266993-Prymnesium_polylepis.1
MRRFPWSVRVGSAQRSHGDLQLDRRRHGGAADGVSRAQVRDDRAHSRPLAGRTAPRRSLVVGARRADRAGRF